MRSSDISNDNSSMIIYIINQESFAMFTGNRFCEVKKPCKNGGECINGETPRCVCKSDYTGPTCEEKVSDFISASTLKYF